MRRRPFLASAAATAAGWTTAGLRRAAAPPGGAPDVVTWSRAVPVRYAADVAVIGGGIAGIGAACAAARSGAKVVLVERFAVAGGMLTTGGAAAAIGRSRPTRLPSGRSATLASALFAPLLALGVVRPSGVGAAEIETDVCVFGGTSGGVVAGVQAARMGKRVVLAEPGRHLGGMTSGGLSAVDIGDPRTVGGLAREYFTRLVASYGKALEWDRPFVAVGGGPPTGGAFAIEPHVAERLFDEMVREAGVQVLRGARLAAVRKDGARIREIAIDDGAVIRARVFLDATYEGDLMAKAGVSYTLQREGNAKYGETYNGIHYSEKYLPRTNHLPPGPHGRVPGGQGVWDRDFPLDPWRVPGKPESGLLPLMNPGEPGTPGEPAPGVQAYCYRLCLTTDPANRMPIAPPANYDPARYEIVARFIAACRAIGDDMDLRWFSKHDPLPNSKWDFNTATFGANLPGASWEWPEASYARRAEIAKAHEDHLRGLLHFLATDPRVPPKVRDDVTRFGLPKDEFPDTGGWPHQLYVREARRMVSDLVMTEHHAFGRAVAPDSIGLGSYGTDTHEVRRIVKDGVVQREGKTAVGRGGAPPYPIGYGAIVPREAECDNLLVTFALSASHTAFSSIRMEPVFMILSQSAATAACLAIDDGVAVQRVDRRRLRERLLADGQIVEWRAPAVAASSTGGSGGTDVFIHEGADWYRIPSLAVAADGTVLAFASRRKGSIRDFGHDTDVVLRRSVDGGRAFAPMQTLASRPGADIHHGPAVVDRRTGRVLKFCRFWPAADNPSKTVAETPYERMRDLGWIDHVMASDDHGATWTPPRALPLDYPAGATSCGTGNGVHGVQTAGGRLLIQGGFVLGGRRHVCVFVSDDGGATWRRGATGAPDEGSLREFGLAEVADGSVYANFRSYAGHRWTARSRDGGLTFGEFRADMALPDPGCHAGLVRLGDAPSDRLAFSNPVPPDGAPAKARRNLTVRFSDDGGATWPRSVALDPGYGGYSDLAVLSDGTLLCLYECGEDTLERLRLARLPPERPAPKPDEGRRP